MSKVFIVGSGNLGANCAFFIAENGVADIWLHDNREGLARGKALDLAEAAPIRGYPTRIIGTDDIQEMAGADVVVVAAGNVQKRGMKREELFEINRQVIQEIAPRVMEHAPESVILVATEPVDYMTMLFLEESGLAREQVLGLGGLVDSTRLRHLIARELKVSPENVTAQVIGRHSDWMIGLDRYSGVSGVPLHYILKTERIEALMEEASRSNDLIVDMAERASPYYAPSAATAELVEAICRDSRRVLSVSVRLQGEYDLQDVALSLPCVIGRKGILRVLQPELTKQQYQWLHESVRPLRALSKGGQG